MLQIQALSTHFRGWSSWGCLAISSIGRSIGGSPGCGLGSRLSLAHVGADGEKVLARIWLHVGFPLPIFALDLMSGVVTCFGQMSARELGSLEWLWVLGRAVPGGCQDEPRRRHSARGPVDSAPRGAPVCAQDIAKSVNEETGVTERCEEAPVPAPPLTQRDPGAMTCATLGPGAILVARTPFLLPVRAHAHTLRWRRCSFATNRGQIHRGPRLRHGGSSCAYSSRPSCCAEGTGLRDDFVC